jgi:hypothetical protein
MTLSRLIRRPLPWIVALAACVLVAGSVALAAGNRPRPTAATASDATFTTLDGANVRVPAAGTATLVYFFAVDCGSCLQTATALAAAQRDVSGPVTYLAVDMAGDRPQDIRGFLHSAGDPSVQVITAGAGTLISRWQVTALGTTIVFDPTGQQVHRSVDPDQATFTAAIGKATGANR